jgi:tetratricopeptide (TPR) repeat protein
MASEWYRKKNWTLADKADFEIHLKRSRNIYNKAQYLRLQAYELQHLTPPLYSEALELLERLFNDFPSEHQMASALLQKAQCIQALHGFTEAIPYYRMVLEQQKIQPRIRTNVWMDFPWEIVKAGRIDLYPEAISVLGTEKTPLMLPIIVYRLNIIFSVIAEHNGEVEYAKIYAHRAIAASETVESGLRYHKTVGLVTGQEQWVVDFLHRLLNK